jgi:hypothetical protein
MEAIKQATGKGIPAWMTLLRYCIYAGLVAYQGWHTAVKDNWTSLTSWDYVDGGVNVSLAILVAAGALMNDSWSNARNETKTN